MFEFVCEKLVPGCTTKERADTRDDAVAKAERHMMDHHDRMSGSDLRAEVDIAVLRLTH